MPSLIRRARATVLVVSLAVLAPAQAGERWRVGIPADSKVSPTVYPLAPLLDGGYLLSQRSDSPSANWLSRWDAQGRLVGGPSAGPGIGLWVQPSSVGALLDYGGASAGFSSVVPSLACRYAGDVFGQPFLQFAPDFGLSIAAPVDLPAGPIHFGTLQRNSGDGARSLIAVDNYCSQRLLGPTWETTMPMLPSRDGLSVFVHYREQGRLRRIGLEGELWSIPLPTETRFYGLSANGDLYLRDAIAVRRIAESGQERWAWPLLSTRYPVAFAGDLGDGSVVLESVSAETLGAAEVQRITVLDASGLPTAQRELQGERLVSPIRTIRGSRLWRSEITNTGGVGSPYRVSRITEGAELQTLASLNGGGYVHFELADGSFLAYDGIARRHIRIPVEGGEPTEVSGAEVPVRRELLDMVSTAEGFVLASRVGVDEFEILGLDHGGALTWRRILGAPMGRDAGQLVLAANAERVCALRGVSPAPTMACLRLNDGADSLSAFAFPLNLQRQRPALRLDEDGAMQVVGELCEPAFGQDSQNCAQRPLVLALLSSSGELLNTRVLSDRSSNWLWSESGRLVHWQPSEESSRNLDISIRDVRGERISRFLATEAPAVVAHSEAGTLLVREWNGPLTNRISSRRSDGSAIWTRTLEPRETPALAFALQGGDWLVFATRLASPFRAEAQVLLRINGEDGTTRWRRLLARNLSVSRIPQGLDAASERLWLVPDQETGGRVLSLDLRDGRFEDAAIAMTPGPLGALRLSPPMLALDGGRPALAWVDQQTQSLQAASFDLPRAEPSQPGLEAGIWHAEDTEGQGLLLQLFDEGQTLAGAWFTFSRSGGHADSEQRWFAVQGERAQDGRLALSLFSAEGGVFAAPPSVEARLVGRGEFLSTGCGTALFTYTFNEGELKDSAGAMPLRRTAGTAAGCDSGLFAAKGRGDGFYGSYFDPETDGQGLLLQEIDDGAGPLLAGAWFTFDPEGAANDFTAQHWFTLLGPRSDGVASDLTLFRTIGAAFDVDATHNTQPVGTLRLEQADCAITVHWRFDDSLPAGAFAGTEGQQNMQRIGHCEGRNARH